LRGNTEDELRADAASITAKSNANITCLKACLQITQIKETLRKSPRAREEANKYHEADF